MKRIFDIIVAIIGLLFLLPWLLIIALVIALDSKGGVFYTQVRVGRDNKDFGLFKFRTMVFGAEKQGELTIGSDSRITSVGRFLRKYKLDEFPQFLNIIAGQMSFVGPRPEVRKYVTLYSEEQLGVLKVRPGLTDYASLEFINESEILGKSENPEETYTQEVMPRKLSLNIKYIEEAGMGTDLKIIFRTIGKIFS